MMKSISTNSKVSLGNGTFLHRQEGISPLVTFRILFGLVVAFGAVRFMAEGWIEMLLIEPKFFFSFWGFDWIPRPNRITAYLLYTLIIISALSITFGYRYKWSILVLFFSFTYAELLDATNYLNHYYLVILLTSLLLFMPAHHAFSMDVRSGRVTEKVQVPRWHRIVLMLQLALVYVFAGIAKVNTDWLLEAMPMAIWLPERAHYPLVGQLFEQPWVAFLFSWAGCIYDLTIVGWLLWKPTRKWAYLVVVAFHLMTWSMFNIGLFPLIMITSTLLFFSPQEQSIILKQLTNNLKAFFRRCEVFLLEIILWNSNLGVELNRAFYTGRKEMKGIRDVQHILVFNQMSYWKTLGVRCSKHVTALTSQSSGTCSKHVTALTKQNTVTCSKHVTALTKQNTVTCSKHVTTLTSQNSGTCSKHVTALTKQNTVTCSKHVTALTKLNTITCSKHVTALTKQNTATCSKHVTVEHQNSLEKKGTPFLSYFTQVILSIYCLFQLALPIRTLAYPGSTTWSEEGYRFGWRVMLLEKVGDATFTVTDSESGRRAEVNNLDYLTPYQEKQMAIQPDFILQFAKHLAAEFEAQHGFQDPIVNVESFVALNGRRSRRLIDKNINLATQEDGLSPKPWILPFQQ